MDGFCNMLKAVNEPGCGAVAEIGIHEQDAVVLNCGHGRPFGPLLFDAIKTGAPGHGGDHQYVGGKAQHLFTTVPGVGHRAFRKILAPGHDDQFVNIGLGTRRNNGRHADLEKHPGFVGRCGNQGFYPLDFTRSMRARMSETMAFAFSSAPKRRPSWVMVSRTAFRSLGSTA